MKFDCLIAQREESAKRARDNAVTICKSFDNRKSGSAQEAEASAFMQEQLRDICDVQTEEFDVYPEAYSGVFAIVPTFAILALVAYFFTAMVSLAFAVLGIVVLVVQFVTNRRTLDLLYPKKKSQNVTAIRHCDGEVKNRVYFVANVDATREWTLKYRMGGTMFIVTLFALLVGLVYTACADIARWIIVGGLGSKIARGNMLIVGYVGIAFFPFYVATYFAINKHKVVPGANENLTGCAVAIELMRSMKEYDIALDHTEVGVVLTGSGAVGSRGAHAWCEKHKESDGAKTVFVCLNTLKEVDSLGVNTREGNGLVKNDGNLADFVKLCADDVQIPFKKRALPFGQTDSAEFSRNGFTSVSVTGYNPKSPEYLHTRYDTHDNVSEACLANAYATCCKIVERLDA